MSEHDDDWFTCPNCGEVVPGAALSCPACGSDDETGWSEDTAYDQLDLPDLDDQASPYRHGPRAGSGLTTWVGAVLIAAILLLILLGLW